MPSGLPSSSKITASLWAGGVGVCVGAPVRGAVVAVSVEVRVMAGRGMDVGGVVGRAVGARTDGCSGLQPATIRLKIKKHAVKRFLFMAPPRY